MIIILSQFSIKDVSSRCGKEQPGRSGFYTRAIGRISDDATIRKKKSGDRMLGVVCR